MAFPNPALQSVYNRYQAPGLPGQLASSDNNIFIFDQATIAQVANDPVRRPSQAVYLDANGEWIVPVNGVPVDIGSVTHILSFENTTLNTPLAVPVGNADSEVVYPANTPGVKAFAMGSVFVTAGATILRGEALEYQPPVVPGADAGNYIVNTIAVGSFRLSIVALSNAESGEVFPVRIRLVN